MVSATAKPRMRLSERIGNRLIAFGNRLGARRASERGTSVPRGHRNGLEARYDAAQTTEDNVKHWGWADLLSADSGLLPVTRRILRSRARYEIANNTYAKGLVETLTNDTIGRGPSLQMNTGNDEWDELVESAFAGWARCVRFGKKLRTLKKAKTGDGEGFFTFINNFRLPHLVKLDMRLFEADQVANPLLTALTAGAVALSDGIVFDDFGNIVAYTLLKYHPGDLYMQGLPLETYTIPASDMIHWFREDRPGQHRGVPEIASALPLFAQLRRYTLAVIANAEAAADITGLVHTQGAAVDPETVEPLDLIDIERRMLMTLPGGWTVSQLKAEQPTTTYGMFKKEILSEIARCLHIPYNIAACSSAEMNYSSGRLDHQLYWKSVETERTDCEEVALDAPNGVFAHWWAEARLVFESWPIELRAQADPPPHSWSWPGRELVDPLKESQASQIEVDSFLSTYAEKYAQRGKDWREAFEQIAAEQEYAEELGITRAAMSAPPPDTQEEDPRSGGSKQTRACRRKRPPIYEEELACG